MTSTSFSITPDWLRAERIVAPELAATWCAMTIRVKDACVTTVEDARGGNLRRQIYVSAYPLAEWIAEHWWPLQEHLRPTGESSSTWTWRAKRPAWLDSHNLRAAGDGMSWPDLSILPEGATSRLFWRAGGGLSDQPVTFLTSGDAVLPREDVRQGLLAFVRSVLARLDEYGVTGTPLQMEWDALGELDREEVEFATAAARLGFNPFDVDDDVQKRLVEMAGHYDTELWFEFLDTADPRHLEIADQWLRSAREDLRAADQQVPVVAGPRDFQGTHPWEQGYEVARQLRASMGLPPTDAFGIADFVGVRTSRRNAGGLQGYVGRRSGSLGLVLPDLQTRSRSAERFSQARALGLAVCLQRESALLDSAGTLSVKVSRAFAAELLAPAQGIQVYIDVLGSDSEAALEAVASRFEVSPLVVQHQYENQLAQPGLPE